MDTSLKPTLLLDFQQFPLYLHIILYPLRSDPGLVAETCVS